MKTKCILTWMTLFLFGTMTGNIQAQSHLKSMLKKCESIDKVDVNVMNKKNTKTGKISKRITNIDFSSKENPGLLKDFLAAFNADKDNAEKVIENKQNGKMIPTYCSFIDGKTRIIFTMIIGNEDWSRSLMKRYNNNKKQDVSISCIERYDNDQDNNNWLDFSSASPFNDRRFFINDSTNRFVDDTISTRECRAKTNSLRKQMQKMNLQTKNYNKRLNKLRAKNEKLLTKQNKMMHRTFIVKPDRRVEGKTVVIG